MGKFGKNLEEMIGKIEKNPPLNIFKVPLVSIINMNHELVELSRRINWESVDKDFEEYYHYTGRPAVSVRKWSEACFRGRIGASGAEKLL